MIRVERGVKMLSQFQAIDKDTLDQHRSGRHSKKQFDSRDTLEDQGGYEWIVACEVREKDVQNDSKFAADQLEEWNCQILRKRKQRTLIWKEIMSLVLQYRVFFKI